MNVILKKPHTHAGKPLPIGAQIQVTAPEAKWLAAHGVIESQPAKRTAQDKE